MTSDTTTSGQSDVTAALCSAAKGPALAALPPALAGHGTILRTRRGQSLGFGHDGSETAFIVRAGIFTLQLALAGKPRQVVSLFFPGDTMRASAVPPQAEAAFVSAGVGEVWRIRCTDSLIAADAMLARYLDEAEMRQSAVNALHTALLAATDCEQRVATLLLELALRVGAPAAGGGFSFELPFGRKDIADLLGLNPDTLSRIMSRFRGSGLLVQAARGRVLVPDLAALASRSPAARSLIALARGRGAQEPLAGTSPAYRA
jgi:CRP-like cAMP-binding protein